MDSSVWKRTKKYYRQGEDVMMLAFLFGFLGIFVTVVLAAALCMVVLNFMFDRTANKLLHKKHEEEDEQ